VAHPCGVTPDARGAASFRGEQNTNHASDPARNNHSLHVGERLIGSAGLTYVNLNPSRARPTSLATIIGLVPSVSKEIGPVYWNLIA
jgi:hypothetical protein